VNQALAATESVSDDPPRDAGAETILLVEDEDVGPASEPGRFSRSKRYTVLEANCGLERCAFSEAHEVPHLTALMSDADVMRRMTVGTSATGHAGIEQIAQSSGCLRRYFGVAAQVLEPGNGPLAEQRWLERRLHHREVFLARGLSLVR